MAKGTKKTVTLKDGTTLKGSAAENYGKSSSPSVPKPSPSTTTGGGGSSAPAPTPSSAYTIKYGDSLSAIARANGTTVNDLMKLNPSVTDPNRIIAGGSLNLPGTQTAATVAAGEAATKAAADALRTQGTTSDGSVVSSSSSKRAEERKIKSDLNGLQPTSAGENKLRSASDNYIKEIDSQIKQLESQRSGDVAGINAQFDETRRQTEDAQVREKGATSVGLARIGGYLGNSASGTGAMLNLAQTHRTEVLSLETKRNAALQEANNAYNERRFEFVKLKLNEAKSIEKEILDRKDKFFEQTIDLANARRQEDEYLREKTKDDLEMLAMVDEKDIDPKKLKEIDEFYGIPGFSQNYVDVTKAAQKAKSEKEMLDVQQKMLTLLQDIPAGQTVKFPDGTQYTGMGKTSDISTFTETDANGNVRLFAYNKGSGSMNIQNLGAVGKPLKSSVDTSDPRVNQAANALEEMVDPATGYVPKDGYISMYREYVKQNNGKGLEFLQNFDPLIYVGVDAKYLRMNAPAEAGEEDEDDTE